MSEYDGDNDSESPEDKLIRQSDMLMKVLPTNWYKLFIVCIQEGFTRDQAFVLVQTYIMATSGASTVKLTPGAS
jgi:hypothetical protein